jgi:hemoglobin-like flavoprotein
MVDRGLQEAMAVARASYQRAAEVPDFFPGFYRRLFEVRPETEPLFAQTEFERQHKLLRHAIGLLLTFPEESDREPTILSRIAERHSRRDLGIEPSLYPPFLESLLDTIKRCDPQFTPAVEHAWRTTLAKGLAYMQSRY